ncbi:methyltransferase [Aurantimonas sp. VKM B-3413]|uniref:class I SAM-dependent methyltransferase n=1 Tax=Aurantimonas sp. VKM B-3413 TaxID=2779401 RepID=UPI001E3184C7|nr:methyltransferase [Aurantimonas sp. VKM B-3413]MCB8837727.1 methyltransferase [Aurantimonas sp. VKM B-3413]
MTLDPDRAEDFIRANTAVLSPPHVPEIRLHLADEAHELWLKTEAELEAIGLPPPFWAFAWAGGQALARYVLDNPSLMAGRQVLDFATGSGLVAIAAASAGAAHVLAADTDPFTAAAVRLNTALNGVEVKMRVEDLIGQPIDADILLAGDVFFDRDLAGALVPWFDRLTAEGKTVIVGDPGRAYLPGGRLQKLAEYRVSVTRALEDAEVKQAVVWRWAPAAT